MKFAAGILNQHCIATATPVFLVGLHKELKIEKVSGCRHVRAVMSYFTKCEQCIIDKCLEIERRIKKLACSASNGEYLNTIFHTCQSRNKGWNEIKIGTILNQSLRGDLIWMHFFKSELV